AKRLLEFGSSRCGVNFLLAAVRRTKYGATRLSGRPRLDCGHPESRTGSPRSYGGAKGQMAQTFTGRKRVRKFFGKIHEVAEMPNLIEVQKASYDQFLQIAEPAGGRPDEGLQA